MVCAVINLCKEQGYHGARSKYCQILGLVLRLRVDFVLPLSQEQEQEEQQQPPTKIYQWGV